MHGQIDLAVEQRRVDLLREQALAANLAQRPVLHIVAGGLDNLNLERIFRQAMRRHQTITGLIGLGKRQRRAARSDAEGVVLVCFSHCYPVTAQAR